MDLAMPRLDGLAALARLTELDVPANVLIFTQDADEEMVMQAARQGAKGYMPKDAPVDRIPKAIRALAAGEAWVERRLTGRVFEELARMARKLASSSSPESLLSEREKEVIRLIACGKTNTEIASQLFLKPAYGQEPREPYSPEVGAAEPDGGRHFRRSGRVGGHAALTGRLPDHPEGGSRRTDR